MKTQKMLEDNPKSDMRPWDQTTKNKQSHKKVLGKSPGGTGQGEAERQEGCPGSAKPESWRPRQQM